MIHTPKPRWLRCAAILAVAIASLSPLAAQRERRPVDLARLTEREAWEAVARAAPDDVFIVRGRRFTAAALKERTETARAAAVERRRKAVQAPSAPDQLVQQLLEQHRLYLRWINAQQEARGAELRAELERQQAPVSREVRAAREEAIRLAAQYRLATSADDRARLKQALADIAERLRRLGSPVETEPDCDCDRDRDR